MLPFIFVHFMGVFPYYSKITVVYTIAMNVVLLQTVVYCSIYTSVFVGCSIYGSVFADITVAFTIVFLFYYL